VKEVKRSLESFFRMLSLSGEFLFTLRVHDSRLYLINFAPVSASVQPHSLLESLLRHNSITEKEFLATLVESATLRQSQRRQNIAIRFSKSRNAPVLIATKAIEPEGVVYEQENARESIVVVEWLRHHYEEISWGDFWSRKSQGWKPIAHSCSPNSHVLLNEVRAIRKISAGEEVTIDFATLFYSDLSFSCACGSEGCRKVIHLNTHNEDWFKQLPSAHLHPWMIDFAFK
jgi:D-alanine-D-alanine ligase